MKTISILLLMAITSAVLGQTALAQENQTEIELPKVGILPSSPIYFLKIWFEKIQLWLTTQPQAQAKLMLKFSENRLAEYQALRAQGNEKLAQRTLELYTQQLEKAVEKIEETHGQGVSMDEAAGQAAEVTQKHLQILVRAYSKAPEPAKKGLTKAIQVSQHGLEVTKEIFSGQRRQEIQEKTEELKTKLDRGIKGIFKKLWPTL